MRIGTRGSALALWQAHTVARLIADRGGPRCEIVVIRTSGDERAGPPDAPEMGRTGGDGAAAAGPEANVKRMFVKEIEDALLEGRVDLAVHSSKDLPADLPDGLAIGAAIARDDPRDVLLCAGATGVRDLRTLRAAVGQAPRIGTSSVRRAAQLRALFPHATFSPIRGNVDTRLRKLDAGDCDLLVLAAAGLDRLGLGAAFTAHLPPEVCVPAPGQGIVAIEVARGGLRRGRRMARAHRRRRCRDRAHRGTRGRAGARRRLPDAARRPGDAGRTVAVGQRRGRVGGRTHGRAGDGTRVSRRSLRRRRGRAGDEAPGPRRGRRPRRGPRGRVTRERAGNPRARVQSPGCCGDSSI